ncbi:beta-galactosidase [Paenibacillus sp. CMAA1364]
MLFGACYYPEHRTPIDWITDTEYMKQASLNALRIGEFAWKRFEPTEGKYTFKWLDQFIDVAQQASIGVVLCPPMRTIPSWLMEKDPTLLIETADGTRLEYASRYTFCINHPLLIETSTRLATALAERYGHDSRILGWHLDNEIGDEPDCHCSICKTKWHQWLETKYEDIHALNEAWGTVFWGIEYDQFSQVVTPRVTKADYNPAFLQAWRQFRSDCNVNIAGLLAEAIRPHLSEQHQYVTTNNQMPWNNRTDNYDMAKHLDITGTNYYPGYGDQWSNVAFGLAANRSFKKAPFHVYELRNEGHSIIGATNNTPAPGELERLTLHTIANGADGVFYFPWKRFPFGAEQNHGAIMDFAGRPTRIYEECKSIGGKLQHIASLITGSQLVSEIAVLYHFQSRWHIEHESSWTGDNTLYMKQTNKLYHTVRELGYNCDAIGVHGDFSAYKILLVPMLPIVDDELIEKLHQFTKSGGILVLHPLSGVKNTEACYYPERHHSGMISLLGATANDTITTGPANDVQFEWNGTVYTSQLFHEPIKSITAESVAHFTNQWFANTTTISVQTHGKGETWYIATFAEATFYKDLIQHLCQRLGLAPLLAITPPKHLELSMRRDSEGRRYYFMINGSNEELRITIPKPMNDIWNQEQLTDQVVSMKPYSVRILTK